MYSYSAYGLGIHCDFPIEGLEHEDRSTDILIRRNTVEAPPGLTYLRAGLGWSQTQVYLETPTVKFLIEEGRKISVEAGANTTPEEIRVSLVGQAFGVLLHQRELLVLHASAVAMDGCGVVFLGGPAYGKSTIAAALCRSEFHLLSDDITAIDFSAGVPRILPGFNEIKVSPETASTLDIEPRHLSTLPPSTGKSLYFPPHRNGNVSTNLSRIYVLEGGDSVALRRLDAQQSLVELMRHSYCYRLVPTLNTATHLQQCGFLAANLGVSALCRPREFALLSKTVSCVESDLRQAAR